MPHIEPLKPSAKQDRAKRHTSPPPGAGPIKKIPTGGRDPRAGFRGPRVKSPNRNYR